MAYEYVAKFKIDLSNIDEVEQQIKTKLGGKKITLSNLSADTKFFVSFLSDIQKIANQNKVNLNFNTLNLETTLEKIGFLRNQIDSLDTRQINFSLKPISNDFVQKYIRENTELIEQSFANLSSKTRGKYLNQDKTMSKDYAKDYAQSAIQFERIKSLAQELQQMTSNKDWFKGMSTGELTDVYKKLLEIQQLKSSIKDIGLSGKSLGDGSKLFDLKSFSLNELTSSIKSGIGSVRGVLNTELNQTISGFNSEFSSILNQVHLFANGIANIDVTSVDSLKEKLDGIGNRIKEINERKKELNQKIAIAEDQDKMDLVAKYKNEITSLNTELVNLKTQKQEIHNIPNKLVEESNSLDSLIKKYENLYGTLEKIKNEDIASVLNSNEEKMASILSSKGKTSEGSQFSYLKEQSGLLYSYAKQNDVDLSKLTDAAQKRAQFFSQGMQYSEQNKQKMLEEIAVHEDNIGKLQQELGLKQQIATTGAYTSTVGSSVSSGSTSGVGTEQSASNVNSIVSSSVGAITQEREELLKINEVINQIITSISNKNNAFKTEEQVVIGTVQREITSLDTFLGTLVMICEQVDKLIGKINEIPEVDVEKKLKIENIGNALRKKINLDGLINNGEVKSIAQELSQLKDIDLANLKDLNKLNVLNNLDIDKVDSKLVALHTHLDDFAKEVNSLKINDTSILSSLDNILKKGDELKSLATVLKASKKQIEEASNVASTSSTKKNTEEQNKRISDANDLLKKQVATWEEISNLTKKIVSNEANGNEHQASNIQSKINSLLQEYNLREKELEMYDDVLSKEERERQVQNAINSAVKEELEYRSQINSKIADYLSKKDAEIQTNLAPRMVNGTEMNAYEMEIDRIRQAYISWGYSAEETARILQEVNNAQLAIKNGSSAEEASLCFWSG